MKYCIDSGNVELVDFVFNKMNALWGVNEFLLESTCNIKMFNYFMKRGAYITDKVFTIHCMKKLSNNVIYNDNFYKMIDYLLDCYPEHCKIKNVLQILSKESPVHNYLSNYL